MKKLMVLGAALIASANLFATPATKALAELHGNLTDRQVQATVIANRLLPLFINESEMFIHPESKTRILVNVKNDIQAHNNYNSYYNGAVVAYTLPYPDDVRNLSDEDIDTVINYTTKALELSRNHQAPDMYLLRALAYMDKIAYQAISNQTADHQVFARYIQQHKAIADKIVRDLRKTYDINPTIGTNYANDLVTLCSALKGNALDKRPYHQLAKFYGQIADAENSRRAQEEAAAQNQLNKQLRREMQPNNSSSSRTHRGSSHPRADYNGMIWPNK